MDNNKISSRLYCVELHMDNNNVYFPVITIMHL